MREQQMDSSGVPLQSIPRVSRWVLCFTLLLAMPGGSQTGSPQHSRMPQPFGDHSLDDDQGTPGDPIWEAKRLRLMNADRQKAVVSDTGKLLKLAHELDSEISSASPDSLTADQIRKLEEIEKLARSVKDKMRESVRGTPVYQTPPPVLPH
jgi:hypothetical protein